MSSVATSRAAPPAGSVALWLLAGCLAVVLLPTLYSLSQGAWTREEGAHGPIILATGGWLLWRRKDEFLRLAKPGSLWIALPLLFLSLAAYVFGRAFDVITLEAGGVYVAGLAIVYAFFGPAPMRKAWFPLLYLAFAVPPPSYWVDRATLPLKEFVSSVSTGVLADFGWPVARQGVTIYVAQYQLLVEDACSGLNSLIGLSAISLLYVYLRRAASVLHTAILTVLVLPIAVAANIVRIMALIVITYLFGDKWGESFIHQAAGLFLFAISLLLVFLLDEGLAAVLRGRSKARA